MSSEDHFVHGSNPVREKLRASPADIREILLSENSHRADLRALAAQAKRLGVPVTYMPAATLDRLAPGQRHQGVIAKLSAHPYLTLEALLKNASAPDVDAVLFLDGLTDPHNFGAILRTAEAAGVRHAVIPKDRSVEVTPAVVKASAGAVYHVSIYKVTNLRRAVTSLKDLGFWIVGLTEKATETIYQREFPPRLGLVLGSEGSGIRPVVLSECDYLVSIPMRGKVSSLNVGVAGGVFLYELVRRRYIDKPGVPR